jgi:hypothetical protein
VSLVSFVASACSDPSTAPDVGRLEMGIRTSGGDIDIDGYGVVVDSSLPRYVSTSAGLYTVNVDGPFVARVANGAYSAPV